MKKKKGWIIAILVVMTVCWCMNKCMCCQDKKINGVTYRPYGPLNEEKYKNPKIHYESRLGPTVSGVLFCYFIVPPIYIFGYNYYEPICLKTDLPADSLKGVK